MDSTSLNDDADASWRSHQKSRSLAWGCNPPSGGIQNTCQTEVLAPGLIAWGIFLLNYAAASRSASQNSMTSPADSSQREPRMQ